MESNKNIKRLMNTARGQLDGILKMIEDDRRWVEVITQIMATQSILRKVNLEILTNNLHNVVQNPRLSAVNRQDEFDKYAELLNKILK